MSSQDSKTNNEDTINLVKKFIASNQRKRRNLVNDIELSAESLYKVGEDVIKYVEREGDDWSIGWVLQVLKKYKPNFFEKDIYNNWFFTNSAIDLNYNDLQLNLLNQDFEEADRLTSAYLRKLAGKVAENRGYVFYSEVKNMPGEDLDTIDRLWKIYSQGKFGFSKQAKILKSVGKRYDLLWPKIGWKKDGIWTRYPSSFCWS